LTRKDWKVSFGVYVARYRRLVWDEEVVVRYPATIRWLNVPIEDSRF